MKTYNKFQIYYKPDERNSSSFTLSISRINEEDDTYKIKIIREISTPSKTYTYKIQEFHFGVQGIKDKINQVDFDREYDKYQNGAMYYVKADEDCFYTGNKKQIQYILDLFQFDELFRINVLQYDKIKDMYEFLKLNDLFVEKVTNIQDTEKVMNLFDFYVTQNPYKVFENMGNLENFLF